MDAASLSSLSRSEIIALAKANKIKANLSTKEIIRQLLEQFPDGVPALSVEDAPVPKRKKFMGRVKDALKAVTGTIKRESPSSEQTAIHNVPNSPLTQRPHSPSDVDSDNEEGTVDDHVEAADPEDIRLVVADMSAISARNKENLARASALRTQASEVDDEARQLRAMLNIEKARRVRMQNYIENWREMDPEWSFEAIWEGPVVLAPFVVGFEGFKGRRVMDMEISPESDDEELVDQWNDRDQAFRERRKARKRKKAEERGVPLDSVSDDELASDEDEFYNPPILHGPEDNEATTDFERYVYPALEGEDTSPGIMYDRPGEIVPAGSRIVKRLREEEPGTSGDEGRYSAEQRVAKWKAYEKKLAEGMGAVVDEKWDGLGVMRTGWRMNEEEAMLNED